MPAEGGEATKLTAESGWAGACTFGAGDRSLVCHRYDYASGDVQRIWLEDGQITPLTIGKDWDYKPAESPDGKWIAFSRGLEGPSGVWLMPAGGGRARLLSRSPYEDRWPTWTKSGDKLFFHRVVDRGTALKLLDRATGQVKTFPAGEDRPLQASLSPDGRQAVYCAQTEQGKVLRLLDLGTGSSRRLPTGPGEACFPRWSPDGRRIAFVSKRDGGRWEVSAVNADGSGLTVLTEGVRDLRGLDGPVDWTPDGSQILFHSDTRAFEANLYTVEVATRRMRRLTSDYWFDEAPSWTPDGRHVLFMSTRGGDWTWGFFRMAVDSGKIEVFEGPDYVEKNFPRMGPDGSIVWSMVDERGTEVLAERSPAGKVRVLPTAGGGSRWPSYSADGRSILYTSMERQVEYWLAENLFGPDSPLLEPSKPVQTAAASPAGGHPKLMERPTGPHLSPIDPHHR
ncbi:MAG: TolB family protein, partial [Thermoanaerobaculia bacterium]